MNTETSQSAKLKKAFKAAFPHTVPVMTGFLILGMAYGILMQTKGYGTLWAVLMSAVAFCGSMQFVAITLLTVAFNPAAGISDEPDGERAPPVLRHIHAA